jgi:histidinol-phosphate aminotransferase
MPGPGILDIAPYVGGESKAAGVERPIRLASNESALGPSPKAIAAYKALAGEIHRYPDGGAAELRAALGRHHGLDPERIVCGAGSDELIGLLQRAYAGPGTEVLYSRHGFLMYSIGALAVGATPVAVPERDLTADVDGLLAHVTERTRIVFIANPNNPTGTYLSAEEMARLHAGLPSNVVLARLRLGWAYCPPEIADVLNRIRGPFNVSAPALAAGLAAVEDVAALARARAHNDQWLPWLSERLKAIGLELTPSVGNFVLARFPKEPRKNADAAFAFLQKRGILVRQMGGYGLLECLRITIGTGEEMEAVAAALTEFMAAR